MSLLEDVFLQDEAGEAQELERIIEGDEYDERPRVEPDSNEDSEKEDEAEEDKRRVDPASTKAKRVVKNPRFVLNPARLTGPRGISILPEHFKDFKFKGKGHEKDDLDLVLKKLEHWAYRLYPKFKFEDCLKKIETLGKKRVVSVHLHKIRSDQLVADDDTVVQKDSSDEELAAPLPEDDEFDQLLQQQIDLARATPGPGERPGFNTPVVDKRPLIMKPKATSSPSITDEQKERMIRNRKMAEERRLARLKTVTSIEDGNTVSTVDLTNGNPVKSIDTDNINTITNVTRLKYVSSIEDGSTVSTVDLTNGNPVNEMSIDTDNINTITNVTGPKAVTPIEDVSTVSTVDLTNGNLGNEISIDIDNINNITNVTRSKYVTSIEDGSTISTVDLTNSNPVNEMPIDTNNINTMTNVTDVIRTKKNRSHVIDSSGEEDEIGTLNQAVTVDVHSNIEQNIVDLTKMKSNITNNEVVSLDIDLDDETSTEIRKKRSVVDSSDDDDDDTLVINESVAIDVHKTNIDIAENQNFEEIGLTDRRQNNNSESGIEKQNCYDIGDEIVDSVDITDQNLFPVEANEAIVDGLSNTEDENELGAVAYDDIIIENNNAIAQGTENQSASEYIAHNHANIKEPSEKTESELDKENNDKIPANEELDDLMDVDFNEDF